jgi:glycosyltransferase involved in cell wall biosynthesis
MTAYAKALRELGPEPHFLVDPAYRRFPELENIAPITDFAGDRTALSCTHALFMNPSVENRKLAVLLKQQGARILYLYHEPWHMTLRWIIDEGLASTARFTVAHHFTIPVLKLADTVILASRYGMSEYDQSDIRYNRNRVCIPLLYDDETTATPDALVSQKRYFGYIGGLARAHRFDQYIAFMRYAFRGGLDIHFMIGSRFPLPGGILNDPLIRRNLDKLEIRCGRPLSMEEMNRCYADSFCIWNIYRRSTQSGVLPKAMMFGTPSLASRAGSYPEFITDGVNGKFADGDDVQAIAAALQDIRANPLRYAEGCRRRFLDTFFYRAQLQSIAALL